MTRKGERERERKLKIKKLQKIILTCKLIDLFFSAPPPFPPVDEGSTPSREERPILSDSVCVDGRTCPVQLQISIQSSVTVHTQ